MLSKTPLHNAVFLVLCGGTAGTIYQFLGLLNWSRPALGSLVATLAIAFVIVWAEGRRATAQD